jgi:hypothetical protein
MKKEKEKFYCIRKWQTDKFNFHYGDWIEYNDTDGGDDLYYNPQVRGSQLVFPAITRDQLHRYFITEDERNARYSGCSGVIRYYKNIYHYTWLLFKVEFDGNDEDLDRYIANRRIGDLRMGDLRISYEYPEVNGGHSFMDAVEVFTNPRISEDEFERLKK